MKHELLLQCLVCQILSIPKLGSCRDLVIRTLSQHLSPPKIFYFVAFNQKIIKKTQYLCILGDLIKHYGWRISYGINILQRSKGFIDCTHSLDKQKKRVLGFFLGDKEWKGVLGRTFASTLEEPLIYGSTYMHARQMKNPFFLVFSLNYVEFCLPSFQKSSCFCVLP